MTTMAYRAVSGRHKGKFVTKKVWEAERRRIDRRVSALGQEQRKAIRARDQARSTKVKAKWQARLEQARDKQRALLGVRGSSEKQGPVVPKGRRLEVTFRFRDTISRRSRTASTRRLHMLKVQVTVTKKGISKAQVERAVEDAIRSGRRTPGVDIGLADWEGAVGSAKRPPLTRGTIYGSKGAPVRKLLGAFVGAMRKAKTGSEVHDVSEKRTTRSGAKGRKGRRAR